MKSVQGIVAGAVLAAAMAGPAEAVERGGLVFGIGGGFGQVSVKDCPVTDCSEKGPAGNLNLGFMLTPRAALMVDSFALVTGDNEKSYNGVGTVGLRFWPAERLWIHGGLGAAVVGDEDNQETGLGFMAGAGIELLQGSSFALDLQGRYGYGKIDIDALGTTTSVKFQTLSAHIGLNWY